MVNLEMLLDVRQIFNRKQTSLIKLQIFIEVLVTLINQKVHFFNEKSKV